MTSPFENSLYNFTSPQGILRDHLRSSLLAYQTQSTLGRINGGNGSFRRPRPRNHSKEIKSLLETYTRGPPTYPSYLEDTIYALLVEEQYKYYCRKYGVVNRNSRTGINSNRKPTTLPLPLRLRASESLVNNISPIDTSSDINNRNTFTNANARRNNSRGARDEASGSSSSSSSSSTASITARSAFFEELDATSPEPSPIDASHTSSSSPLYFSASGSSLRYNSYLARLELQDLRLPTAWSSKERGVSVDLGENSNEITYKGTGIEGDASSVRSNYSAKSQCGLFYYEVKIEASDENSDGRISIGFCDDYSRLDRLPGSDDYSWAYHGENGYLTGGPLSLSNRTRKYGTCFGIGDTIGCGIDFSDRTIFYTRNGIHLGTAFRDVKGKRMYPIIGFKTSGEKVTANFGQDASSFIFDIRQYRKDAANRIVHHILSSTSLPAPPPSLNETQDQQQQQKRLRKKATLVDHLVVNYLNHAGYMDTFTAMKKEMTDGMDEQDQARREKVKARQDICMALRNGQIDQVFIQCEQHYPHMLARYPRILFRLQCQKFMALADSIRSQQKSQPLPLLSGHLGKQQRVGDKRTRSTLEMDDDNNVTSASGMETVRNVATGINDNDNDDDDDDDDDEYDGYYYRDLQIVLDYGRYLQQTYGSNKVTYTTIKKKKTTTATTTPSERSIRQIMNCEEDGGWEVTMKETLAGIDVASELKHTFSMLAYAQSSDSPNGYLSGPKWREGIASELNAAMLVTEGEHPESSLERLYRQTSVTMHELVLNGNGQASLVAAVDSLL
ncbi:unnamed protein product [Absidia cylindrospora]